MRIGLLFALVAAPAISAWVVWQVASEPIMAEVVGTPVVDDASRIEGRVRWTADDGRRRTATLELTDEHLSTGTVPILAEGWSSEAWVVDSPPIGAMTGAASLAFLLVLVVAGTLRGYGFVRGTGRSGEMSTNDVQESRGFYWRH